MHISTVAIFLTQILLILALSRVAGMLALRIGQPKVVGEMLAGIVLGPSLFGWIAPELWATVFPADSVELLQILAQLGVVFFMFLIGLELDARLLRGRGDVAVVISHVSIIAPFLLGALLTLLLYPLVFNDTPMMRFTAVSLFMGAAMSVTAFPVLARILTERNLHKTKIGAIAITCAAVDDVSAWCMLAFVVAVGRAEGLTGAMWTAGLSGIYVLLMLLVVRPGLVRLQAIYERRGTSPQMVFALVLVMLMLSALATEWIGIHALFGAFLMGVIMPRKTELVHLVTQRLEDLTIVFLLPIFFAYAGLRTQIGLLDSPALWGLTILVIFVACLGKFGGSALAARMCGLDWRESSAIGVLMNTRGLMELVILTMGLQMGVITDAVFAMMVLMALVTTAMTTPILQWVYPRERFEAAPVDEATAAAEYGVLIPVSRPESGPALARLVSYISGSGNLSPQIYALTLERSSDNETFNVGYRDGAEQIDRIGPLARAAGELSIPVEPLSFVSRDLASDIARVARMKRADLVLMGSHKPVFGSTILGGTVHRVLTGADTDVAVFVDRGLGSIMRVLVPFQGSAHDRLAVDIARRMAEKPGVRITLLHVVSGPSGSTEPSLRTQVFPDAVEMRLVENRSPVDAVIDLSGEFDLVIVGLAEEWGLSSQLFGLRAERIAQEWAGSLLLVRKYVPIKELTDSVSPAAGAGSTAPVQS